MTPEQITLVQLTFARIQPQADSVAQQFYNRLFSLDPSLRPMFKTDMAEQGHKLMSTLELVVNNLQCPEILLPKVHRLGQQHVEYGVQPEHYDTVGAALLATLAQGLGPAFTPEVEAAWQAAYSLLAGVMQVAANEMASP